MTENEKIDINGIAGAVAKELAKLKEDSDKGKEDSDKGKEEAGFNCPECGTVVKGMTTYCPGCGCELDWEA